MKEVETAVYVLDDDDSLLSAIEFLFQTVKINVRVYNNPQKYFKDYNINNHGCLLLDVRMPTMGGFEVLEELQKRKNRMPVIMLTGHGDVPMAVRAMKEGAIDFILKPFNDEVLLEKVQRAISNDKKRQVISTPGLQDALGRMTPRERQVMELIAEGNLSKQIAGKLGVSPFTVDFHRANLMSKLNVKTIPELIKVYFHYSMFAK